MYILRNGLTITKYLLSTVSAYLENRGLSCKCCSAFYKTACSHGLDSRGKIRLKFVIQQSHVLNQGSEGKHSRDS
jgi:hypothetical protein